MANEEFNEQEVLDLAAQGFKPAEIGEQVGISAQKVGSIIKKASTAVAGEVVKTGIQTMSSEEYMEYSRANGRTGYGGEIGVKYDCSIEDLRAKINSNWKPSMVMEKYQIDEEELKQLVWSLSKKELRDVPVKFDIKHDYFRG